MGTFIQISRDLHASTDYSQVLSQFKYELSKNNSLSLSRFCASRHICYQRMLKYIEQNGINLQAVRQAACQGQNTNSSANNQTRLQDSYLTDVSINTTDVKVIIHKIAIDQLADLLNSILSTDVQA